jgi:hypothetical protein
MVDDVNKETSIESEFTWAEQVMMYYEQMHPDAEPLIDVFRRRHKDDRILAPLAERIKALIAEELPKCLKQISDDRIGLLGEGDGFEFKVTFKSREERETEAHRTQQVLDSII